MKLNHYNLCDGLQPNGQCCEYPAVRGVHLPAVKRHRYTWLCDEHSYELEEHTEQHEQPAKPKRRKRHVESESVA